MTEELAEKMAVTQRPVTREAISAPSGERPLWRELPSRFVIGEQDRTIPAQLQHFMADRAGARTTLRPPYDRPKGPALDNPQPPGRWNEGW